MCCLKWFARQNRKRMAAKMRYLFIGFSIIMCMQSTAWAEQVTANDCIRAWEQVQDELFAKAMCETNEDGFVIWGTSRLLSSYLTAYEVTQDERWLHRFCTLTQYLMRLEQQQDIDTDGVERRGWQTGPRYLFSQPALLVDDNGQPALEVTAIRKAENNKVAIAIERSGDQYNLLVRIDGAEQIVRFESLEQSTVEGIVNRELKVGTSIVMVRQIGSEPPAAFPFRYFDGHRCVLSTFHNPRTVAPMARFVWLVHEYGLGAYEEQAESILAFVQSIEQSQQHLWREDHDSGWLLIDPTAPIFWAGMEGPYNVQSMNGLMYTWLWLATGEAEYYRKAQLLAKTVQESFFWYNDMVLSRYAYKAYSRRWQDGESYNVFQYHDGAQTLEDAGHLISAIEFITTAYRYNVAFSAVELGFLRAMYKQMVTPDGLHKYVNGTGETNHVYMGGYFCMLPGLESETLQEIASRYMNRYTKRCGASIVNGWANLARALQ